MLLLVLVLQLLMTLLIVSRGIVVVIGSDEVEGIVGLVVVVLLLVLMAVLVVLNVEVATGGDVAAVVADSSDSIDGDVGGGKLAKL